MNRPAGLRLAGHRVARPVRPVVPIVSSAAVLLAWGLVAHNSGAGWVQAIGDALAGTLVVGLIGPAFVAQRARVLVTECPADATAGLPAAIVAVASTRLRVQPLDPEGPVTFVGPRRSAEPTDRGFSVVPVDDNVMVVPVDDSVMVVPAHRGVYRSVSFEIASAAPFGLLWWTRRVVVTLPRELVVAPRLGVPEPLPPRREDGRSEASARTAARVGEPRGVRPYRPGDLRRVVHWPATAHTGDLMVRETEGPAAASFSIEVHLPEDTGEAERMAERALASIVTLLDRGSAVVLTTTEPSGTRTGVVTDRRAAGRRLARAVGERHGAGGVTAQPPAAPGGAAAR